MHGSKIICILFWNVKETHSIRFLTCQEGWASVWTFCPTGQGQFWGNYIISSNSTFVHSLQFSDDVRHALPLRPTRTGHCTAGNITDRPVVTSPTAVLAFSRTPHTPGPPHFPLQSSVTPPPNPPSRPAVWESGSDVIRLSLQTVALNAVKLNFQNSQKLFSPKCLALDSEAMTCQNCLLPI